MTRLIIILAAILALAVVGLLVAGRRLRYALVDRPYIASVKLQLRAVAAAQETYRSGHAAYASEVAQILTKRDSVVGVGVRIVAATADGFLAEGVSAFWSGRCVIAAGSYLGDSLKVGEPRCREA